MKDFINVYDLLEDECTLLIQVIQNRRVSCGLDSKKVPDATEEKY